MNERLAELIQFLGVTQRAFASRIGFSPSYITLLLNGQKANPSPRFFTALYRTYNVNTEWLKYGIGDMFVSAADVYEATDMDLLDKYNLLPPSNKEIINELIDTMIARSQKKQK